MPVTIRSQRKPDQPWIEYETRTLDDLPLAQLDASPVALGRYGGWLDRQVEATGFFYATTINGRWWLVDPEGYLYLHQAVVAVSPGKSDTPRAALRERFGAPANWAAYTTQLLQAHGFNGTGAWSDVDLIRAAPTRLAYTTTLNLLSEFGRSKNLIRQLPGHVGYPGDCLPVFHPEFPGFCDRRARALVADTAGDPWLLGHFSDNEMPIPVLEKFLALSPNDPDTGPGYQAARAWLAQRKGPDASVASGSADITDADRDAWVEHVIGRYLEITTGAIRKYDPNHLCLGPRFHGKDKNSAGTWRAAGKYLDVIAINYYNAWGPEPEVLSRWLAWSGKPCMITEWYVKGADAGYANWSGAGWIVPTQQDRGAFYQHYVLGLIESGSCVGWHWFKYMDNDPADLITDPSNRDSNKGIVNIRYEEYTPLLEAMKALNDRAYAIADL
jgi:hypothetical protein